MRAFSVKTFSFCSGELVFCVIKHKNKRASKKYALRYTNDLPTLMTGWTFHKMQWALDGEGVLNFIVEEMKNYKSTDIRILLNESPNFEIEFDNLFYKPIPKGMNYLAPPILSPNFDIKYFVKQLHKNGVKTSPELTPFEIMRLYIEMDRNMVRRD
ncbi:MAG: hypothetical protein IJO75_06155 [Clostridia bacterium]|nr:hypothetical protein [Clostridia bacterium]